MFEVPTDRVHDAENSTMRILPRVDASMNEGSPGHASSCRGHRRGPVGAGYQAGPDPRAVGREYSQLILSGLCGPIHVHL